MKSELSYMYNVSVCVCVCVYACECMWVCVFVRMCVYVLNGVIGGITINTLASVPNRASNNR